jgi:hypothetical protein
VDRYESAAKCNAAGTFLTRVIRARQLEFRVYAIDDGIGRRASPPADSPSHAGDSHLCGWRITPQDTLTGIDLGAQPGIELVDTVHFNDAMVARPTMNGCAQHR